jgi:hypothetical protein
MHTMIFGKLRAKSGENCGVTKIGVHDVSRERLSLR